MAWVVVDAPKVEAANVPDTLVAVTAPIAYVRFHGRNAGTWNVRGGSAAQRFDYLYGEDELRELGRAAARARRAPPRRPTRSSTTTTRPTASRRRPPGPRLLRKLLDEESVPTA